MQHEINQAAEARTHINLCNINTETADQSQRLAALRLKYSGAIFELIPSSYYFTLNSETFSFAIRHRLGLNVGIGFDYNTKVATLLAKSKLADFYLHNAIRDTIASTAAKGDVDIVIREPNQLWIDPLGSGAVVPDLAWKRDGMTYALDVHTHTACNAAGRPISTRITYMDNRKKNGTGTMDALIKARAAADTAAKAAKAAKAANAANHLELAAYAAKKRAICCSAYTPGYDIAAAACGDTFLPAGFTEFAGWSMSAKQILPHITHKGDCLKADEEGERFDAGAEATWATRKHRCFMIHAVAAAAARANYRAAAAESKRRRLTAPLPVSTKQRAFQFQRIHAPCHRARRNAEMRHLLPITVR